MCDNVWKPLKQSISIVFFKFHILASIGEIFLVAGYRIFRDYMPGSSTFSKDFDGKTCSNLIFVQNFHSEIRFFPTKQFYSIHNLGKNQNTSLNRQANLNTYRIFTGRLNKPFPPF